LSRKNKGKSSAAASNVVLADGANSGESAPVPAPVAAAGGGSSMVQPIGTRGLLQYPRSPLISSPFGQAYMTERSRGIVDDMVQMRAATWYYNIVGYTALGSAVTTTPSELTAAGTLLDDWYVLGRQQGKAALKYKHTPLTITAGRFADFLNVYIYAVATCVTLFNADRLYQYNQAGSTFSEYLPKYMSRVTRLYRRLNSIMMAPGIVALAVKMGMIAMSTAHRMPPHIRLFDAGVLVAYGGATDYDAFASTDTPITYLNTDANLLKIVNNIERAVWALEGTISFDATTATDFTAIKDMMDMLNDVGGGLYRSGLLPDEKSFPGLVDDRSLLNDWYDRGNIGNNNSGTKTAQGFPIIGLSTNGFNSRIPIMGFGAPSMEEFTLFGAIKAFRFADTDGAVESASTTMLLVGMLWRYGSYASTNVKIPEALYTREDGWVTITDAVQDYNDGSNCRAYLNTRSTRALHRYDLTPWLGLLSTGLEYKWVEEKTRDYCIWMEPDDLGPNTAMLLAQWFGIPYIK